MIDDELLKQITEALTCDHGLAQEMIAKEGVEVINLLLRKNRDYGSSALVSPMLCPGLDAQHAIQCRLSDKINRFLNLMASEDTPAVNESVNDTVRDMIGYWILWLVAEKV